MKRRGSEMKRVAIIAISFVVVSMVLLGGMVASRWDGAVLLGRSARPVLAVADTQLDLGTSALPRVIFLGDSTLWPVPDHPSYPTLVARRVDGRMEVRSIFFPGFDFTHYNFLLEPILDAAPRWLVLVAHLRTMVAEEAGWAYPELSSWLPVSELPRTAGLSLHRRGITVPTLLLSRLLRFPVARDAFYFAAGLRGQLGGEVGPWVLPESPGMVPDDPSFREAHFRRYDVPLYPHHPMLRTLEAILVRSRRRGVSVLVLVSPVPVARLQEEGLYVRARYERRIGWLRAAAEKHGARVLDLHAAVRADGFRDDLGHLTGAGAEEVADHLVSDLRLPSP